MTPVKKSIQYGEHTLTIETGEIAKQASGSVIVSMGDTVVLVTVVGRRRADPGRDFFPLTVDYQEKTYAAGRIPGGFFRREGRPTEKEILTCRLIDRPIRPLFPKGFTNEVQIMGTVLSVDVDIDPDLPTMIGASAATSISGLPFNGPIGAARVGYKDGQYILNPGLTELETSELNLTVAGTANAVLMVESEAIGLSEEVMLGSVMFGHEQMQPIIKMIEELAAEVGKPRWEWNPAEKDEKLASRVADLAGAEIKTAYQVAEKMSRQDAVAAVRRSTIDTLVAESADNPDGGWTEDEIKDVIQALEKKTVRAQILAGEPRIDGRDTRTVRPVTSRVGVLPRTHGSALFTRGETQAMVVTTLGSGRDSQIIDAIEGERREAFLFHYNFPPYCVGETGRNSGPKRREIGHGRLARRGIQAVMPDLDEFPYVVRVVSEITES
nr:polyribonucleotide nucleotidyltransferase [Gammaproteobacteria bacterium]